MCEPRKVKACFGRWGEKDCFGLFNCNQYKLCSRCYWNYYFKAKKKFGVPKFILRKTILKFCEENNLILPEERKKKEKKNEIVSR